MSSLCIALIFTLLVIFLIILLSAFFQKKVEMLTANVSDNVEYVEIQLRELLKKYPKSEIYLANISKSAESYAIIERLAKDFPQIHIRD